MAVTIFSVNDPLTNKLYSRLLTVQSITETYIRRFMGTTPNSLIQVRNETQKAAGDRITVGLRVKLSGAGRLAPAVQEGHEEAIVFRDDSIVINKLRHAVRVKAKRTIEQQRVPFELRDEGLDALGQWWADRTDMWFANQIAGYTATDAVNNGDDVRYTGLQAPLAPDSAHILRFAGDTTDADIVTTGANVLRLDHIDLAVEKAKTSNPLIRPVRINGQDWYVLFIHTFHTTQLRASTGDTSWYDIQSKALQGGEISGNPIFTGALGAYNQTIIHEWDRLPPGVGASATTSVAAVRRAVFCGAQSAWVAYGQDYGPSRYQWVEDLFDYSDELGMCAGCIAGLKKSRFNSADFGTIVIPTHAAATSNLTTTTVV